jgi:hypothetical protein
MENKICPCCGQTLLTVHSVINDDDCYYEVLCCWCDYKSELYETKQEAVENYETSIFRL